MPPSELARRTRTAAAKVSPVEARIREEQDGLSQALSDRVGIDRFIRAAVTSFAQTPRLRECTPQSVLGALYVSAQLGLEVGGPRGLAYLVPFWNKDLVRSDGGRGGFEAQLIVGYRGFVDLFYKAGAKSVQWFVIREGDLFRKGSDSVRGDWYVWEPASEDEERPLVGCVALVHTATGGIVWHHMTKAQILKRRPKKWEGTPWRTWPEEQSLKTVLRGLAKRVAMSTELAVASDADQSVQRRIEGLPEHDVLHVPVEGGAIEDLDREEAEQEPAGPNTAPEAPSRPEQAPRVQDPPAVPDAAPPPPEEDDWEARERAQFEAWRREHPEEA